MPRIRSRRLAEPFRALFGAGTLAGLGEGALLDRFVSQRDETAFEEIVARHGPMVLGVCRRWLTNSSDVEDAIQAVFLILVRKAATLKDRNSLSSWLYGVSLRVARRARIAAARRTSRERANNVDLLTAQTSESRPADCETLSILDDEIRRLPEKQQAVIVLCLVQEKTHEAAAVELGCPLGTVKSRLAGGKATLIRRLTRGGLAPFAAAALCLGSQELMASLVPKQFEVPFLDAALRRAMSHWLQGAAIAARVQTLADEVILTMRLARFKTLAIGAAAAGFLLCASTAFLVARQDHMPEVPRLANDQKPNTRIGGPSKLDLHGDPLPSAAVVRLGTIRHRQEAPIYRIAFTRDGKYLVTDGDDGQLRVWNPDNGNLIRRIAVEIDALSDFALSSDSKTVATTGINFEPSREFTRHVDFIDIETGRRSSRESWVENLMFPKVALDPDRKILVTGDVGGELRVTRVASKTKAALHALADEDVKFLAFSTGRARLAVASSPRAKDEPADTTGRLRVFDVTSAGELRPVSTFQIDLGVASNIAFSPDGSLLAVTDLQTLVLLDVASGTRRQFVHEFIRQVTFSADGHRLAGIDTQGDWIQVWDSTEGRCTDVLRPSSYLGGAIAFSSNGRCLAVTGGPNVLHLWDIGSRREKTSLYDAHDDRVNVARFTHDGKMLITGSADRTVRIWSSTTGRQLKRLKHEASVTALALSQDGRSALAAIAYRPMVYLWDLTKDKKPLILDVPGEALDVAFSDRDQSLLSFTADGTLCQWNSRDHSLEKSVPLEPRLTRDPKLKRYEQKFKAATFFAGGDKLAVIGFDTQLHIIDAQQGTEIGSTRGATRFAVSPDQKTLAIATDGPEPRPDKITRKNDLSSGGFYSTSGTIVFLDSQTLKEKLRIEVDGSEVWAIAFSPDGKTLAATSGWEAGQIHFYDVASGRETLSIDTGAIHSSALAFSPDGSKIVCGMADTSVLVWVLERTR